MRGKFRKSRFHDEKGNVPKIKSILINGVNALFSALVYKISGYRPQKPWISYEAISFLAKRLKDDAKALEYGSGMSTLWLSDHVKEVFSVEDNLEWYELLLTEIKNKNISNIILEYRDRRNFFSFPEETAGKFDFILVDGSDRDKCMEMAINRIASGGIIYLDNSDKGMHDTNPDNEYRRAEGILIDFANKRNAEIRYFTDFAPTSFFVQQGLMIILPGDKT